MDFISLKYENRFYRCYPSQSTNELLDLTISLLTTEEIYNSDYYREFIYELPYNKYSGNAYYLERIDDYIIIGFVYGYDRVYLPLNKFENFMSQWRKAYNDKPSEMIISVDNNKNFKITYENCQTNDELIPNPESVITKEAVSTNNSRGLVPKENYMEFEPIIRQYYVNDASNPKLNLFADLLTGEVPLSNYKEKLKFPPYEYYDDRYFLAIVEDRILIYDKTMEIKVFPKFETFIDLIHLWKSAINQEIELVRLYINDDYKFKIMILKELT